MRFYFATKLSGIFLLLWALVACNPAAESANRPSGVVEAYFSALTQGDVEKMVSLSCADWERDARIEVAAFVGVESSLKDVACSETGSEGNFTTVSCTGSILASYGDEQDEFPLNDRVYRTIQEAGEWRMCGY
jgi:hypothetical protein